MAKSIKPQRDRKLFVLLMIGVVAYWALGLTVTIYKREPYPALMMPDFLGTGGLKGTDFNYYQITVIVNKSDGQAIESTLVETLVRSGYTRGQASVLNYSIVQSGQDEHGEWFIADRDQLIWEIALKGNSPDGTIEEDEVESILLVYDKAVLDIRQWPDGEPTVERLAESEVLPWQP